MRELTRILGPLRTLLIALALLALLGAPFAGGEVVYTFPAILPSLIAPPFAVMVAFVIPLDILMTSLFLSERSGEEQRRLRIARRVEVLAVLLLVAAWAPFFNELGSR